VDRPGWGIAGEGQHERGRWLTLEGDDYSAPRITGAEWIFRLSSNGLLSRLNSGVLRLPITHLHKGVSAIVAELEKYPWLLVIE
jgi:hypothetical protein